MPFRSAYSGESTPVSLLGIDLAWSPRNTSGVAALRSTTEGLVVEALGCARSDEEILALVDRHRRATTVVCIDAPLVVPNDAGGRACDRLTHTHFGRFQAGAYLANRTRLGA